METNKQASSQMALPDDEREYFLTKWHHVMEMVEWVPEVADFFEEKFGVFWEGQNIDTLNDALSQWYPHFLQKEARKIEEEIKRMIVEEAKRGREAKTKNRKTHWAVKEIKPFQPRGYKDFSDWCEIGDDTYLE